MGEINFDKEHHRKPGTTHRPRVSRRTQIRGKLQHFL